MNTKHKTSIGGQALIEGVMMRGPKTTAMAVRNPEGELVIEKWRAKQACTVKNSVHTRNFYDGRQSAFRIQMPYAFCRNCRS